MYFTILTVIGFFAASEKSFGYEEVAFSVFLRRDDTPHVVKTKNNQSYRASYKKPEKVENTEKHGKEIRFLFLLV